MRYIVFTLALWATATVAQDNVSEFTLSNGLQAIVIEDHRAPVVVHAMWYKTGSADEDPGKSGIAHYLEHLMFKATETLDAGEFSETVAANGGSDNAFTSFDYTAYFQRVASDRLELMMQMEASRVLGLQLVPEDIATERDVVEAVERAPRRLRELLPRVEGPAAQDENALARLQVGAVERVQRNGEGLAKRGGRGGDFGGDGVDTFGGDGDVLGEPARMVDAGDLHVGTGRFTSRIASGASATRHQGFDDDGCVDFEAADAHEVGSIRADRFDASGDFVAGDQALRPIAAAIVVEVAAAESAGIDRHANLARMKRGLRRVRRFDASVVIDDRRAHYEAFRSSRSRTARTMIGHAIVASAWTSTWRPPSLSGTNLPQETPSV